MIAAASYGAVAAAILVYSIVRARRTNGCLPNPRILSAQVGVSLGWLPLAGLFAAFLLLLGLGARRS
jgi:hypothetical protein